MRSWIESRAVVVEMNTQQRPAERKRDSLSFFLSLCLRCLHSRSVPSAPGRRPPFRPIRHSLVELELSDRCASAANRSSKSSSSAMAVAVAVSPWRQPLTSHWREVHFSSVPEIGAMGACCRPTVRPCPQMLRVQAARSLTPDLFPFL